MNHLLTGLVLAGAIVGVTPNLCAAAEPAPLVLPPQNQGLPYTRSARAQALARIAPFRAAVFPGSRYAYANGLKVRLDEVDWRQEAVMRDGVLYVPAAFAPLLAMKQIKPAPAPEYLSYRWVYTLDRPAVTLSTEVRRISENGKPYVAVADVAAAHGLKAQQHPSGVLLVGDAGAPFDIGDGAALESVITLFDTPEKFADPDIATRHIPTLARQGKWTEHVNVTPEQLAWINGPETKWQFTPESEFDLRGFNTALLGSKVPPPGVYPRVLFSPEDVAVLAKRLQESTFGRMSLMDVEYLLGRSFWDPTTSDGKAFRLLYEGDIAGFQKFLPEHKQGIFNSHIGYFTECLSTMALYCLLTNDDVRGRQAAAAIATYYRQLEPAVDQWNAKSDSEFAVENGGNGAETHWRGMHGIVSNMNAGLCLDFGGKWMTAEEKDMMRRVLAKATYGRRAYGQDGPVRFRDVNWVTWDLPQQLALAAIEGLEGFDPEAWESNCETVRAFCQWGISPAGVVYESNGKSGGSFQAMTLSMVTMARRGQNLFGHPHFRKLLEGQIQMTSPSGKVTVNSGTQYAPYSQQPLSYQFVNELKSFYPGSLHPDYLLSQINTSNEMNEAVRAWKPYSPEEYRQKLPKIQRFRMPSPTYSGFVRSLLYDADFKPTSRAELNLPLEFSDPIHGVFSAYSDASPEAAWINMMVRPNHYIGAGHHHPDAGMLHFSALGVDWFTESPFSQAYEGKLHNHVLVDGVSQAEGVGIVYQAAAKYLGASTGPLLASASADLTESYSYAWLTQPDQTWSGTDQYDWELDPSPRLREIFAGTARYKMRPWWSTYTFGNYLATARRSFNPMQHVYRTVALVRGGERPYGVVADDLKKDSDSHLYQWTAMLSGGVWEADVEGLAKNQLVLGHTGKDQGTASPEKLPKITPQRGDPLLLVWAVGIEDSGDPALPVIEVQRPAGPAGRKGEASYYNRISINRRGTEAQYRVVLLPFRYGDPLPQLESQGTSARIGMGGTFDVLTFERVNGAATRVSLSRQPN